MAAENLQSFVGEIKKTRYCLLPNLSEDDILRVWKVASEFVQRQMHLHKGVAIPGLGVFTFSQKKIDVGSNKFIVIQRPVFVLLEKFVQTHSLRYPKQHTSGQIPTVPLNFTVLSNETPFNRDSVETCIHEVIQSMSRLLASKGSIQLEFSGIGRLFIREGKVKMRFFREFITQLDSSGVMESAFRPGTAQTELSIMSESTYSRPGTQALVLPRIVETSGSGNSLSLELTSGTPQPSMADVEDDLRSIRSDDIEKESTGGRRKAHLLMEARNNEVHFEPQAMEPGKRSPATPRYSSSPESRRLVPKPAALFVGDDANHSVPGQLKKHLTNLGLSSSVPASPSKAERGPGATEPGQAKANNQTPKVQIQSRPSTCSHSTSAGQELCYLCHQRALRNIPVDMSKEKKEQEKVQDNLLLEYQQRRDLLALANEQAARMKTIGFNREMASVNLEAAQRTKATRMTKDSEFYPSYVFQHRPLTPPRHIKQNRYCVELDDQVSYVHGQARERRDREEKEEREEQHQLAKELEAYQEAYLNEKAAKVAHYQRALAEQIAIKRELGLIRSSLLDCSYMSSSISKAPPPCNDKPTSACSTLFGMKAIPDISEQASTGRLSGKLRPLSLPKPTIILPFSHSKTMTILKDGHMKPVHMKPLAQVEPKSSYNTAAASQQPVFGVQEVPMEKLREQKERARELFLEQLAMVAEKDRKMKEKGQRARLEEAEMLSRTRKDLIDDIHSERLAKLDMRKSLEQSWNNSMEEKHCRSLGELNHSKQPSILLHQQCERYHRCKQCKRRRENHGESNLLHESRYISGSRLMV